MCPKFMTFLENFWTVMNFGNLCGSAERFPRTINSRIPSLTYWCKFLHLYLSSHPWEMMYSEPFPCILFTTHAALNVKPSQLPLLTGTPVAEKFEWKSELYVQVYNCSSYTNMMKILLAESDGCMVPTTIFKALCC